MVSAQSEKGPKALILAPTRELALQVRQHMDQIIYRASVAAEVLHSDDKKQKSIRFARVAAICGGMSVQKQKRLLSEHGGPDAIVATPGRLWELLQEVCFLDWRQDGLKLI
jgi:ATP-dependent RNA helicase DDX24/MAK5